jgi:Tfp pilus assembly protein PilN
MKPTKQSATTYWHPSFRVVEALPDTKVIRTSFAVNAVAIAAALAAGAFLYSRESALADVSTQIDNLQEKVEAAKPRVAKAFELQKEFSAGEKKVREIEVFLAPKLVASDFLAIVSETLPRLISLDSIEMSSEVIRLRGTVVGSSERSAPLAKAYAEQLSAHPVLKEQMASIKLNNQNRDQSGDRFTFEIELRFKAAKPAPVAPKKAPKPSSEDQP